MHLSFIVLNNVLFLFAGILTTRRRARRPSSTPRENWRKQKSPPNTPAVMPWTRRRERLTTNWTRQRMLRRTVWTRPRATPRTSLMTRRRRLNKTGLFSSWFMHRYHVTGGSISFFLEDLVMFWVCGTSIVFDLVKKSRAVKAKKDCSSTVLISIQSEAFSSSIFRLLILWKEKSWPPFCRESLKSQTSLKHVPCLVLLGKANIRACKKITLTARTSNQSIDWPASFDILIYRPLIDWLID